MPTRDRLAHKTKQRTTYLVSFGWCISIIKTMFINNAPSCPPVAIFLLVFASLLGLVFTWRSIHKQSMRTSTACAQAHQTKLFPFHLLVACVSFLVKINDNASSCKFLIVIYIWIIKSRPRSYFIPGSSPFHVTDKNAFIHLILFYIYLYVCPKGKCLAWD
jgi:hypothetical protein